MSTPEDRDAYLSSVLIGGQEPVTITVVDDDEDWPLRESAADRALYAAIKRDLAHGAGFDMNDYADAKSDVVLEILGRARDWRNASRH